ncbi:MAG: VOC family protein [Candidatus Helarchaeota archaeon]
MAYIYWIDIPVTDLEGARKFYSKLFDWKINDVEGADYLTFEAAYPPHGNLVPTEDIPERGITPYIMVDDIDKILDKVQDLGGRILITKTLISEEIGYRAEFVDLFGNKWALLSPPEGSKKSEKPKKEKKAKPKKKK